MFVFFVVHTLSSTLISCFLFEPLHNPHIGAKSNAVTVTLPRIPCNRQTLLFSATALRAEIATKKSNKDKKWLDKVKIKGIGGGAVKSLPLHLQQLLSVVSVMGNTHVADVTGSQPTSTSSLKITNADGADKSQREVGSKNKGNENGKEKEGGDMKKQKLNKSETNAGEEKKNKSGENKKNAEDEATENKTEEEEEEVWDGTGEGDDDEYYLTDFDLI